MAVLIMGAPSLTIPRVHLPEPLDIDLQPTVDLRAVGRQ